MSELSYLEKLLDGVEVEWVPVSELFQIKNGYTPSKSKKEFWENGTIPWFRLEDVRVNGRELNDSIQHINPLGVKGCLFPKNSIFMSTTATIGEYALVRVPYLTNQQITNFSISEKFSEAVNIKYIFYMFYDFGKWCTENANKSGGVSIIGLKKLSQYQFPIPCPDNPEKSLAIQSEIVRILDKFTALTAELTAELNMRKKQYNYYRDQLLSFKEGEVKWKTLGEITEINTGQKPSEILDKAATFDYINAGTSRSGYTTMSNCDGDTVTTPSRGQGGIGFVGYQKTPFWLGPLCYKIKSLNNEILINKFLFYTLQSRNRILLSLKKEGGVPAVNKIDLAKLIIPLPSLDEQKRIVSLLDKFDTLTNSITEGLPREIELRQKQYEYYRDLLFSFPKPETVSN
ncbi:restriction endonuclease subunit S [Escherichia coli]|uniref:restriction endonuclease subunit S n=1 Tax=Escherichia coli TaxID=562 RepID=UPI001E57D007|nr:restriction endonuclease subunit S [Escherichia coli]EHU7965145.1 restriction endonuclease subunit S [Escherichia coli]EJM9066686.1 restriction endonuclease subunit S [Escherichia coli]EKS5445788.1 restriction endonuclease subunit S [Escherichia coli]MCD6783402.1 restriction endonuclease subunit S [Escherichia coli]MEB6362354.1 restriction endonuclease subunit S [Escherichia coli]